MDNFRTLTCFTFSTHGNVHPSAHIPMVIHTSSTGNPYYFMKQQWFQIEVPPIFNQSPIMALDHDWKFKLCCREDYAEY
jgi:hypothetical protein